MNAEELDALFITVRDGDQAEAKEVLSKFDMTWLHSSLQQNSALFRRGTTSARERSVRKRMRPESPRSRERKNDRRCLEYVWQVVEIDLIEQRAADKTRGKRHRHVFIKLRAFWCPTRNGFVLIWTSSWARLRENCSAMFGVSAPAGLYHGCWNRDEVAHGKGIPTDASHGWRLATVGYANVRATQKKKHCSSQRFAMLAAMPGAVRTRQSEELFKSSQALREVLPLYLCLGVFRSTALGRPTGGVQASKLLEDRGREADEHYRAEVVQAAKAEGLTV
ncbi:unnamed protein product [Symbiodinium sp. CCMP2592]|nr:unnamed protein product [Symbiodinium sp. CCMP2592]